MPFSLRLDPETEAALRRLTRSTGRSKSAIVREAVAHYGEEPPAEPAAETALDRLRPFVGIVATGGQYSTDTHAKYRAALQRKHRGRRPG
jgi:predicted DNA-binding protein